MKKMFLYLVSRFGPVLLVGLGVYFILSLATLPDRENRRTFDNGVELCRKADCQCGLFVYHGGDSVAIDYHPSKCELDYLAEQKYLRDMAQDSEIRRKLTR